MSFSRLNTCAFNVPSSFNCIKISTFPTITDSVTPPTGTPTFPLIEILSLICVLIVTPTLPEISFNLSACE